MNATKTSEQKARQYLRIRSKARSLMAKHRYNGNWARVNRLVRLETRADRAR